MRKTLKDHTDIVYQEESDSTAQSDGVEYNLNVLFQLVADQRIEQYKVSDLEWVMKYTKTDPERVANADLQAPILVAKYKNKLLVLDGAHRLKRALKEHKEFLPGRMVSPDQLEIAKVKK